MKKTSIGNRLLGEIVADDFRAATVFKEFGIDFCCGGKLTLDEACRARHIGMDEVVQKLNDIQEMAIAPGQNYKEWALDFLADYIVITHHRFVLKTLPDLVYYTEKIAGVHGVNHPELTEVAALFAEVNKELQQHLKMEEEVLFPAIKEVIRSNSQDAKELIRMEIARMTGEHEQAGGAMDRINILTNGYHIPADACNTYRVSLNLLHQFEDDLHIHVHLENNILFPKALML